MTIDMSNTAIQDCDTIRAEGDGNRVEPDELGRDILVDSYGRKHNYLRISLTERCNLRCVLSYTYYTYFPLHQNL